MKKFIKILVADDDPLIVAATRRVLESAGYTVFSAQDGEVALEATRAQHPDLLLLDVNMPKMDGFEVCRQIKADPALAGTFIIIMSSTYTDSDSQVNGLNLGADGYLPRPIANRELLARVEAMLRIQAAEQVIKKYSESLEELVAERTRELREAEEQLVRQAKLAVLGQMAGSVGHELRNPLAVIKNAVYFLKLVQPEADETIKEYLALIEKETGNAEKIITDLLDFARLQPSQREAVCIPELVERVLRRYPAPDSVKVTLDLPPDLPGVNVDPRQMEQVFGNLALNACQAMENGGQLTIFAAMEGESVKISVQDSGTGIPPENMPKLFEPLFTTKPTGIGLGLPVCKNLVEANGGRIEVESEPGIGSTFKVWLPRL
jgi:signal transduction histidine kinase